MLRSDIAQSTLVNRISENSARKIIFTILQQLNDVGFTLSEQRGETHFFGDKQASLQASMTIETPRFYQRLLADGSIGAGEAYIDGWWNSPDLTKVIQVLARNMATLDKLEARVSWLTQLAQKIRHFTRRNNQTNAKQNISAHYDLGNDLYRQFLDPNMLYSSGLYLSPQDHLAQAQINKMERLCQQLQLNKHDHLLEIGTGWGAMAIYAAQNYGCRVTTTTISEEQYAWAQAQIKHHGLEKQITLLFQDYRELKGQYDKLVSIEMIEAVGKQYLATYINQCQRLLKPHGIIAMQAITIADQRYDSYSNNVDFIQKHIFPGGFLPSLTVLLTHFTQHSDFVIRDIKDIGVDYAKTLADWHQQFNQNSEALTQAGYDERFMRMWRYYFCYCEGGFLERSISTVQLIASRPGWRPSS